METLQDRLLTALKRKGITKTALADQAGLKRTNVVYLLSGRNKSTTPDNLQKLAKVLDVSFSWLAGGALAEAEPNTVAIKYVSPKPIFNEDGSFKDFEKSDLPPHLYPIKFFKDREISADNCFLLKVSTENMIPLINPNDSILIDQSDKTPWQHPTPHVYSMLINNMLVIYKIRAVFDDIFIESINSVYETIKLDKNTFIEKTILIGRVIDKFGDGGL